MFWIIVAGMVAVVALAIALPFLRGGKGAEPAAAYDLRVYRDQLREVDRDRARGVLNDDDAGRLRTEIGRKVLDADRALSAQGQRGAIRSPGTGAALAVLAVLLAGGAGLYALELGAPRMPDAPLSARIAAAEEIYQTRPAQAEAEAAAPAVERPEPDAQYLQLVESLRDAVGRNPDPQGLALLARHEGQLGNFAAAREAQTRLIAARGAAATADDHARLASLMIEAAGGIITPEAEAEILRALQIDPREPLARFMQGLLFAQNGRPDRTFPVWADLLATGPQDAPFIEVIRGTIQDLAWLAGQPNYVPPMAQPTPGPDAESMAAMEAMSPEERQMMIGDMVTRLESRLAQQGGTPEEWARLISALVVIGDEAHAHEIWTEAQTRFAPNPEGLAVVTEAARAAGLTDAAAPGLPGPTAEDMRAAAQLSAAEQGEMVAGMVRRLHDRLTTEGGTGEEWARLVSALVVQGDDAAARDMLARGRAELAGDAPGLEVLNGAARQAGIE